MSTPTIAFHWFKVWGVGIACDSWLTWHDDNPDVNVRLLHVKAYLGPLLVAINVELWSEKP